MYRQPEKPSPPRSTNEQNVRTDIPLAFVAAIIEFYASFIAKRAP
jgi:hypothetical protein